MNSNLNFKLSCVVIMFTSSVAFAEGLESKITPELQFSSDSKNEVLKAGIQYHPAQKITKDIPDIPLSHRQSLMDSIFSLYTKIPTSKENPNESDIDKNISSWRIGIGYDTTLGSYSEDGHYKKLRLALNADGGFNTFSYTPNGNASNKKETTKASFSSDISLYYFIGKNNFQYVPQLKVSYNRNTKEAEKVGVVSVDTTSNLTLAKNMIISPPSATPEIQYRLAVPIIYNRNSSSFFQAKDIPHPRRLLQKIKADTDPSTTPVSGYIWQKFGSDLQSKLNASESDTIIDLLVSGLNDVLQDQKLYEKSRFKDIDLGAVTKSYAAIKSNEGENLLQLNRLLLQDTYKDDVISQENADAFGIGPSIAYKMVGEDNSYVPEGKVSRLVSKLFFYYYPTLLKGGGRIGVAPFIDTRISGEDKRERMDYGVLVELRVGANLWDY